MTEGLEQGRGRALGEGQTVTLLDESLDERGRLGIERGLRLEGGKDEDEDGLHDR
ncbi:MAG: hypothetical protein JRG91_10680 [Deltaproteobacteria bacterium]|nr:hypothetical protein [Deltaproteobacteria bacterium]